MWNPACKLTPGTRAPKSGQYQQIGPRGERGAERTVVRGTPLPPTPKPGMSYTLVDPVSPSAVEKGDVPFGRGEEGDETTYLLSSPENARRLRHSIAETRAGKVRIVDPRELGIEV